MAIKEVASALEVASYRLTNWDRDAILKRALEAGFDKQAQALAKRENAIAVRCYNNIFSADDRKKIAALPDGWLPTDASPSFNVGGLHIEFKMIEPLRIPHKLRNERLGSIKDRDLIDAVNQLLADKKDHDERRSAAKASAKAILYSVTTAKKLIEVWPQAKPFLQGIGVAAALHVPATQIIELNKMLGLKQAS